MVLLALGTFHLVTVPSESPAVRGLTPGHGSCRVVTPAAAC